MFVLKSSIEKLLEEAELKGYERGLVEGYRNCENNQGPLLKKVRELGCKECLEKSPFFEKRD
jgi:hypothetical protein